MTSLIARTLALAPANRAARFAADWIDLQWSQTIAQLTAAAPRARGRLLDVGCGDKPYEHLFLPYVSSYVGIEFDGSFAQTSASHASLERGPDHYYDGKTLPFADQSFDTVLSVQVLEHTPHPQRLLNEMARVLHKDGVLILSAPFSFRLHEEPHDYFRYSPHGLRAMAEEAGLEITDVWNQGDLWSVVAHKVNCYLAFKVMRVQSAAQTLGKLKHEGKSSLGGRLWLAPIVGPSMVLLSAAARVLDRVAPDGTEALSFMMIARPKPR